MVEYLNASIDKLVYETVSWRLRVLSPLSHNLDRNCKWVVVYTSLSAQRVFVSVWFSCRVWISVSIFYMLRSLCSDNILTTLNILICNFTVER